MSMSAFERARIRAVIERAHDLIEQSQRVRRDLERVTERIEQSANLEDIIKRKPTPKGRKTPK